jgi:DNA repair protein RadA/Sms
VAQVRESTALLVRYAKQSGTAIFLVGHVTKEGSLAGPRVLEHMVDTVLYFEGESDGRLRLLRAVKNRFGAVNELGVFGMTDRGLKEVSNPSAIFLNRTQEEVPGSVVMARTGKPADAGRGTGTGRRQPLANLRRVTRAWTRTAWPCCWRCCTATVGLRPTIQDVFLNVVG